MQRLDGGCAESEVDGAMIVRRGMFDYHAIADQSVEMPPHRRFRSNLQQQQLLEAKRRALFLKITNLDGEIEIFVSPDSR